MSVPLNNLKGFCLATFVKSADQDEEVSAIIGRPRGEWHVGWPLTIYPTLQSLIDATPGYSKKTHFVNEVIIHVIGERVEIVTV